MDRQPPESGEDRDVRSSLRRSVHHSNHLHSSHHHSDGLRLRSDSSGSIRSAFYQGKIVSTPSAPSTDDHEISPRRRAGKRATKRSFNKRTSKQSPPREKAEISTSDVANMAMSSVDNPTYSKAMFRPTSLSKTSGAGHPLHDASKGSSNVGRMYGTLPEFSSPQPLETIQSSNEVFSSIEGIGNDWHSQPSESLRYSVNSANDNTVWDSFRQSALRGTNFLDTLRNESESNQRNSKEMPSRPDSISSFLRGFIPSRNSENGNYGNLSSMKHSDYGTNQGDLRAFPVREESTEDEASLINSQRKSNSSQSLSERLMLIFDPTNFLKSGVEYEEDGVPYFDDHSKLTLPGIFRSLLYNPIYPEFTSLQQFSWSVIIGVVMGFYTAYWKALIEACVEFVWKKIPETLLELGIFTEGFPLYHYMWITTSFFGGLLSYIFAALPTPIPGQNEWIHNLHSRGVQESDTFFLLFVLSTAGMASGLSLGPELPLVLTAGMFGSWLGVICKQSMLQARILNLTAASAAVGGFFGFPMAGALFVLEVPHRTGLQYFEALSPATMASIVAVLTNRLVTGNEVTGYYQYPFLNSTLPSEIFTNAIIYGLFGAALGIFYTAIVLWLKHVVHDLFHKHDHDDHANDGAVPNENEDEKVPLMVGIKSKDEPKKSPGFVKRICSLSCCIIPHEPIRAAAAGTIAGGLVGTTCIFFPHVLFWGEAQLQNLIDKGRTPLPVFGEVGEATAGLLEKAYCVIGPEASLEEREDGFGLGCSAVITLAKIFVTGLSLGTGIIGGHFWGPLFAGCSASHFLMNLCELFSDRFEFFSVLADYPCVSLLCVMGSAHVVPFRAHTAIILILTLTIDAFDPKGQEGGDAKVAGDYSAIFPLLTVAVFISLQISRQHVFYAKQRSRGDIQALPEALCEPGKEGKPLVMGYDGHLHDIDSIEFESESDSDFDDFSESERTTQEDIEDQFQAAKIESQSQDSSDNRSIGSGQENGTRPPLPGSIDSRSRMSSYSSENSLGSAAKVGSRPPRPKDGKLRRAISPKTADGSSDNSVDQNADRKPPKRKMHRRVNSAPVGMADFVSQRKSSSDPPVKGHRRKVSGDFKHQVHVVGILGQENPDLLEQARQGASTLTAFASLSRDPARPPKQTTPRRSPPEAPKGRRLPLLNEKLSDTGGRLSKEDLAFLPMNPPLPSSGRHRRTTSSDAAFASSSYSREANEKANHAFLAAMKDLTGSDAGHQQP